MDTKSKGYFDGHYVDSNETQAERDKEAEQSIKENENLSSWGDK
jgi:hypothetical protein